MICYCSSSNMLVVIIIRLSNKTYERVTPLITFLLFLSLWYGMKTEGGAGAQKGCLTPCLLHCTEPVQNKSGLVRRVRPQKLGVPPTGAHVDASSSGPPTLSQAV